MGAPIPLPTPRCQPTPGSPAAGFTRVVGVLVEVVDRADTRWHRGADTVGDGVRGRR